ncbi:MAG: PAS domain-containing protein, partial [Planctomycetota bacterium]
NEYQAELEFYKAALDARAIVSVMDRDGSIVHSNRRLCTLCGFGLSELIGANNRIHNSGYHPRSFYEKMYETIYAGKVWRAEMRNRAKDGTIYWVDTTIIPKVNPAGEVASFFCLRDQVQAPKLVQEDLSAAMQAVIAKGKSLVHGEADFPHQTRPPPDAVTALSRFLVDPALPPGERADLARAVQRDAECLVPMLNNLLDVSRVEAGLVPTSIEPVNLIAVLSAVCNTVNQLLEHTRATVSFKTAGCVPPVVQTDVHRLRPLLFSLIERTVRLSPARAAEVCIRTDAPAEGTGSVVIEMTARCHDASANGIDLLFQAPLFDSGDAGGFDFELLLARRLAQTLGASIEMWAEPDLGLTCSLRLPQRTASASAA